MSHKRSSFALQRRATRRKMLRESFKDRELAETIARTAAILRNVIHKPNGHIFNGVVIVKSGTVISDSRGRGVIQNLRR